MSSRIGLWLSSSRSTSPRVPTVEYARSERSSAKSSQAARNSALSRARSSALAPAPGGVELEERELDERAVGHETKGNGRRARGRDAVVRARGARRGRVGAEASVTLAVAAPGHDRCGPGQVRGMSLGLMSAGIGQVPSRADLPGRLAGKADRRCALRPQPAAGSSRSRREVPNWAEVIERADDAPADLIPGLLATRLRAAGVSRVGRAADDCCGARGRRRQRPRLALAAGRVRAAPLFGLAVVRAGEAELPGLVRRLAGGDLLIALAAPPPGENEALPIGIAGRGFDGDLTSDSTQNGRLRPLDRPRADDPAARSAWRSPIRWTGEPIRSEGELDPGAIEDRARRMEAIPDRRAPVVIGCLAAWVLLAGAAAFAPAARRRAFAWLALAFAYMPLMLLAGAAIEPSAVAEACWWASGQRPSRRSRSDSSPAGGRWRSPARSP